MPMLRSFIAIELPAEAQAALSDLQNRLKTITPAQSVRWTSPAAIHLTLHFLGDIVADDVTQVTELMRSAVSAYSPFSLTIGNLGCFPNPRRPRIIWAGISGQTDTLVKLQHNLGEQLKTIGFTPEARPYAPHLTLGRVKDRLPQRQLTQLGQVLEQFQPQVGSLATLTVAEISLIKSELKPTGAIYTQLASVPFRD